MYFCEVLLQPSCYLGTYWTTNSSRRYPAKNLYSAECIAADSRMWGRVSRGLSVGALNRTTEEFVLEDGTRSAKVNMREMNKAKELDNNKDVTMALYLYT